MYQHAVKILGFLDRRSRYQICGLFAMMLVVALLETAGLGLILPLLQVMSDPDKAMATSWLKTIRELSGVTSQREFVIAFCALLAVFFVFKNIALVGMFYIQNLFIFRKHAHFTGRLYKHYLDSHYSFHLQRNTAETVRNLTQSTYVAFSSGLMPLLSILMEGVVMTAICVFLITVEPVLTPLLIGGLAVLALIYDKTISTRLYGWGERLNQLRTDLIQWVNQSLGSIKEVKVFGADNYFDAVFRNHLADNARYRTLTTTAQYVPRGYMEIMMVLAILIVVIIVMEQQEEPSQALPILGLFGAAGVRIAPAISRILAFSAILKTGVAAINDLDEDWRQSESFHVESSEKAAQEELNFNRDIRLENISYSYADGAEPALNDISVRIARGESVALVGQSGSGKTTLANIILGLLEPDSGRFTVDGVEVRGKLKAWQKHIGYVDQSIYLLDDTLRRNVAFGLGEEDIDDQRIVTAIRISQLDSTIQKMPQGLNTVIGEGGLRLSGGQRQRVAIARALYHEPQLLLLDEATSALDSETESNLSNAIESLHGVKTLIVIAHRLSTIKGCDRILFLSNGRIEAVGRFDELADSNRDFRRMVDLSFPGNG